jgi:hypothetical protein
MIEEQLAAIALRRQEKNLRMVAADMEESEPMKSELLKLADKKAARASELEEGGWR